MAVQINQVVARFSSPDMTARSYGSKPGSSMLNAQNPLRIRANDAFAQQSLADRRLPQAEKVKGRN